MSFRGAQKVDMGINISADGQPSNALMPIYHQAGAKPLRKTLVIFYKCSQNSLAAYTTNVLRRFGVKIACMSFRYQFGELIVRFNVAGTVGCSQHNQYSLITIASKLHSKD